MGGKEAIQILREINPGIRAIVSSGYSSDPILSDYQQYGFCGVLSKPYNVSGMAALIKSTME
jgi:DNA-binding NarL/FixJ family response regulator